MGQRTTVKFRVARLKRLQFCLGHGAPLGLNPIFVIAICTITANNAVPFFRRENCSLPTTKGLSQRRELHS